jgi:Alw26I/Eco31I/Esp3I family type II restriction m6 adenine DNA methyltransferase
LLDERELVLPILGAPAEIPAEEGLPHLTIARSAIDQQTRLWHSLTGRYYTPRQLADHMIRPILELLSHHPSRPKLIRICDPFAGDGRLILWLIRHVVDSLGSSPAWDIHLWDLDSEPLNRAQRDLDDLASHTGVQLTCVTEVADSFLFAPKHSPTFDIVITNPPWENLKPDRRELSRLSPHDRDRYVRALRATDAYLAGVFPRSQPRRKFAGWGTNLARVGTELAARLTAPAGILALVSPASILSDGVTANLRAWLLEHFTLHDIAYFPAESRAFPGADTRATTTVWQRLSSPSMNPRVTTYDAKFQTVESERVTLQPSLNDDSDNALPFAFGLRAARIVEKLQHLPTLSHLEGSHPFGLWAGRELDETGVARYLRPASLGNFIKGFMIERFTVRSEPTHVVIKPGWVAPPSVRHARIVWRDVSRPNQKRRVQATIIPPEWVAGNSLGVAYFRDDDTDRLLWLLGIMSSCVFECQLRSSLATGHVTLASLRTVRIPPVELTARDRDLITAVQSRLKGHTDAEADIEALAAHLYRLTLSDLTNVLESFPKLGLPDRMAVIHAFERVGASVN